MHSPNRGRQPYIFTFPIPPPFSYSRQFLVDLTWWWLQLLLLPVTFAAKWLYYKIEPIVRPVVGFLWRNKGNVLKAGVLSVFFFVTTLTIALSSYYLIRSYLMVNEHVRQPLYFDFGKATPTAIATFNEDIVSGQEYHVYIDLEMPESPINIELGMFMVTLQIYDGKTTNSTLILDSTRPALIRYKTSLLRMIHSVFFAFPSVFGLYEEKQTLEVPLADHFSASQSLSSGFAQISLSKSNIEVYSSNLHICANLSWFSYLVVRWPVFSFFVGTVLMFALAAPGIFFFFFVIYLRVSSRPGRAREVLVRDNAVVGRRRPQDASIHSAARASTSQQREERGERGQEDERDEEDEAEDVRRRNEFELERRRILEQDEEEDENDEDDLEDREIEERVQQMLDDRIRERVAQRRRETDEEIALHQRERRDTKRLEERRPERDNANDDVNDNNNANDSGSGSDDKRSGGESGGSANSESNEEWVEMQSRGGGGTGGGGGSSSKDDDAGESSSSGLILRRRRM